ncbi:hypothetical protein D805_0287 [Bifidobacterium thermophilum RBL67]|uniref:Uncharacterized protein n=1 Tax=Bifidobacterium thermophilum RBL67 TaxID=1254439 RepID=M4REH6_9BIFI|nr:hypothetical protein D805_0287 [Bifidobacterium thermophilum RBL67]
MSKAGGKPDESVVRESVVRRLDIGDAMGAIASRHRHQYA